MNKTEFLAAIAAKNPNLTKVEVAQVVNSLFDVVKETTTAGQEIRLVGFGNFTFSHRKAKKGRNPKTGELLDIPASTQVVCKLSQNWAKLP